MDLAVFRALSVYWAQAAFGPLLLLYLLLRNVYLPGSQPIKFLLVPHVRGPH